MPQGRRLTNAESELLHTGDLYTIDEDLVKEITDCFTGPYKRETLLPCEGCGSMVTFIDEMPAGCMRLGIPHVYCAKCIRKILEAQEDRKE